MSTQTEMQAAVDSCAEAYKSWSQTTVLTRQQIMFRYADLVRKNLVSRKHERLTELLYIDVVCVYPIININVMREMF